MAARDGDKMRRSRHRKPVARRLGAQLGRTTADDTGYERTRRVGRRRDGRKQPISQPKQRPRRALIDRHNPNGFNLAHLASEHARAPIRIVLKARNAADNTHMRPGTKLTVARQANLTQAPAVHACFAGVGIRPIVYGRITLHDKLETACRSTVERLRGT